MSDNPGMSADALRACVEEAMWDSDGGPNTPVVASTPHGSYTFAVDSAEWDGQRIVLRLREIGRVHDMRLSVRSPDVWVECSCGGLAQDVGAWPTPEQVAEVARAHRETK